MSRVLKSCRTSRSARQNKVSETVGNSVSSFDAFFRLKS